MAKIKISLKNKLNKNVMLSMCFMCFLRFFGAGPGGGMFVSYETVGKHCKMQQLLFPVDQVRRMGKKTTL